VIIARPAIIADDLTRTTGQAWTPRALTRCLDEIEASGMAESDRDAGLIVLTKALIVDGHVRDGAGPASPNAAKSWATSLEKLPRCSLRDVVIERVLLAISQSDEKIRNVFAESECMPCGRHDACHADAMTHAMRTQGSGIRDQGSAFRKTHTPRAREAVQPFAQSPPRGPEPAEPDPPVPEPPVDRSRDTHAELAIELHDAWCHAGRAIAAEVDRTAPVGGAMPDPRHLEAIRAVVASWSIAASGAGKSLATLARERMAGLLAVRTAKVRADRQSLRWWAAPTFWALEGIERDQGDHPDDILARKAAGRPGHGARDSPVGRESIRGPARATTVPRLDGEQTF
jgi:hypothetical protein